MIEVGEESEALQEETMLGIRDVTVALSASKRKVEFVVELREVKAAVYRGPPGRVVLSE